MFKKFFQTLKSVFYNPAFYQQIPKNTLGKPVRFLFLVVGLFILISGSAGLPSMIKGTSEVVNNNVFVDSYPSGLVVNIEDGVASANVEQPFFIPIKEEENEGLDNFLVINTEEGVSLDEADSYNSVLVLLKNKVIFQDDKETRTLSLDDFGNYTLTQEVFEKVVVIAQSMLWPVFIVVGILIFAGVTAFMVLSQMVVALVATLVVLVLSKVRKVSLSYGNAYKIALYALVPGLLLKVLLSSVFSIYIPFWGWIAFFIFILAINLKQEKAV